MIISGNGGEIHLESKAKNVKVSAQSNLERKDLSGQSSRTETASAGNKPKSVSVACMIPYDSEDHLTALSAMADALEADGSPVIYNVADRTCRALKIRQVIFSGTLSVKEADGLECFDVSFSLKEQKSVSEQAEANAEAKTVTDDSVPNVSSLAEQARST